MTIATLHAGCVLVGVAGVLIEGASGSGKSTLARRLLDTVNGQGRFARLVADDRTRLERAEEWLVARPVPEIAGLIEVRGAGILKMLYAPSATVRLVVELRDDASRFPESDSCERLGVTLPLLVLQGKYADPGIVLMTLKRIF